MITSAVFVHFLSLSVTSVRLRLHIPADVAIVTVATGERFSQN